MFKSWFGVITLNEIHLWFCSLSACGSKNQYVLFIKYFLHGFLLHLPGCV